MDFGLSLGFWIYFQKNGIFPFLFYLVFVSEIGLNASGLLSHPAGQKWACWRSFGDGPNGRLLERLGPLNDGPRMDC